MCYSENRVIINGDDRMLKQKLGKSDLQVSNIALGCMRMSGLEESEVVNVLNTAVESGINLFEHADIYGGGTCEEVFSKGLQDAGIKREDILIQTKAGIRPDLGMFDFSKAHLIHSVDQSLKRLKTDYVDIFALHRPDTLMDPEEVAEAFNTLQKSGKVRHFGVSNQNVGQMELLQKYVDQPLLVNQLQFSLMHTPMIDHGFNVNMKRDEQSNDRDGGILTYTRLNEITIQAWSPYQYGFFEGVFIDHPAFPKLNEKLEEIGRTYNVSKTVVATAWILTHPAKMQVVIGTMNAGRIADIATASSIRLTRHEWYDLYRAAGNVLP